MDLEEDYVDELLEAADNANKEAKENKVAPVAKQANASDLKSDD